MTSAEIAELREFISGELQKVQTRFDDASSRLSREETQREEMWSDCWAFGEGFRSWGGRLVALEDRVEGMEANRG